MSDPGAVSAAILSGDIQLRTEYIFNKLLSLIGRRLEVRLAVCWSLSEANLHKLCNKLKITTLLPSVCGFFSYRFGEEKIV